MGVGEPEPGRKDSGGFVILVLYLAGLILLPLTYLMLEIVRRICLKSNNFKGAQWARKWRDKSGNMTIVFIMVPVLMLAIEVLVVAFLVGISAGEVLALFYLPYKLLVYLPIRLSNPSLAKKMRTYEKRSFVCTFGFFLILIKVADKFFGKSKALKEVLDFGSLWEKQNGS